MSYIANTNAFYQHHQRLVAMPLIKVLMKEISCPEIFFFFYFAQPRISSTGGALTGKSFWWVSSLSAVPDSISDHSLMMSLSSLQ